jgi:glycosyltransferase involved in cell wall biosynthesis
MRIAMVSAHRFYPDMPDGGSLSAFQLLVMLKALGDDVQSLSFLCGLPAARCALDALGRPLRGQTRVGNPETEGPGMEAAESLEVELEGVCLRWRLVPAVGEAHALRKSILDAVRSLNLDAAILLDDDTPAMLALAELGIPAAHLLNSLANVESLARANRAFIRIMHREQTYAASRFIQGKARELLGLEISVLNPCIDFRRYLGRQGRERLGTVGYIGGPGKGDHIVTGIIERLPEVRFLIAGNYNGAGQGTQKRSGFAASPVMSAGNVEYLNRVEDMSKFYDRIDLLLVPSTVEDAFPRVILEAAANGIPAIANRVGGIPEALGDGGITIEFERGRDAAADAAERYARAIRRLRDDTAEYVALSRKARERAGDYAREQPVQVEILRRAFPVQKRKTGGDWACAGIS